jgi:hypothetical protein
MDAMEVLPYPLQACSYALCASWSHATLQLLRTSQYVHAAYRSSVVLYRGTAAIQCILVHISSVMLCTSVHCIAAVPQCVYAVRPRLPYNCSTLFNNMLLCLLTWPALLSSCFNSAAAHVFCEDSSTRDPHTLSCCAQYCGFNYCFPCCLSACLSAVQVHCEDPCTRDPLIVQLRNHCISCNNLRQCTRLPLQSLPSQPTAQPTRQHIQR